MPCPRCFAVPWSALALAVGLPAPAAAAPGQLVPTFGNGGIKTQQIGNDDASASGLALAPDGKLLTGINLVLADATTRFGVARFTAAGQLDTAGFDPPEGANHTAPDRRQQHGFRGRRGQSGARCHGGHGVQHEDHGQPLHHRRAPGRRRVRAAHGEAGDHGPGPGLR